MNSDLIFLYGPPGSGKTLIGSALGERLNLPFIDLDVQIERETGRTFQALFEEGESVFRSYESQALRRLDLDRSGVIALGGGALLDAENRRLAEQAGRVLCLTASSATLLNRLEMQKGQRPLLHGNLEMQLESLLNTRLEHYNSFASQLKTDGMGVQEVVFQSQVQLGMFHLTGMGNGYDVRIAEGCLENLGSIMRSRGLAGPVVLVSDENVAQLYGEFTQEVLHLAGYAASTLVLPPGEQYKTVTSLQRLWQSFLSVGMERSSTVVALGGGVLTDLAGFAAATYMRGIDWVCVPTSLIGMVDASLGGKTGVDLTEGKNLVGAFHPPRLVLVDPHLLVTLPEVEQRNGLAEVVKHALIADPQLLELCRSGLEGFDSRWQEVIRRAMAVKINLIELDPFDRGARSSLNLGHTLGHAIEQVSGYRVRHGEAVAIGMVFAARLSASMGMAPANLIAELQALLSNLGLPVNIPQNLELEKLLSAMRFDKKRRDGKFKFVLLIKPGDVRWNQEIEEELVRITLEAQ